MGNTAQPLPTEGGHQSRGDQIEAIQKGVDQLNALPDFDHVMQAIQNHASGIVK